MRLLRKSIPLAFILVVALIQGLVAVPWVSANSSQPAPAQTANSSSPETTYPTAGSYGRVAQTAGSFTVIHLPDTQYYSSSLDGGSPAIFYSQTRWVVNNRTARNIVFVTHSGDIVESADATTEWDVARSAMSTLEGRGVPYGMAVGNHDEYPNGEPNGTTNYNRYFGTSRFAGRSYYGGHYGSNNDNHYELFSASGMSFIVIYLKYGGASQAVLSWADSLLKTNKSRRAIVTFHDLVDESGNFSSQGGTIYHALRANPNLFLMIGGHYGSVSRRSDTYNGHTVYSLMADFSSRSNGGDGWLRILEFSPAENLIHVKTYSPYLNRWDTTASNQFDLSYNMTVRAYTLSVDKTGTGNGTITSSPSGIKCGATCTVYYNYNTAVTLSAVASVGSTFTGWSGACTGTGACTVTMNAARSVTATFTLNTYTLTVSRAGSGSGTVTSSPSGIHCGATCTDDYNYNTSVTLSAAASVGSTFSGWSGACTGTGACTVTVNAAKSVTASFTQNVYTLTVNVMGNGSVTRDKPGPYSYGDVVRLTAVPDTGWSFESWSGDPTGTTSPMTITIDANKTVTTTFTQNAYTLTVNVIGKGTVTRSQPGPYHYGDAVQLTATPDAGWSFASWSGDLTETTNPMTITLDGSTSITAIMVVKIYLPFVGKSTTIGSTLANIPPGIGCDTTGVLAMDASEPIIALEREFRLPPVRE